MSMVLCTLRYPPLKNMVTEQVNEAIHLGKITEAQREHYTKIGLSLGADVLKLTLNDLTPSRRPSEVIRFSGNSPSAPQQYAKLSDVPSGEVEDLKAQNPQEYARLYKAEFGVDLPL